MYLNSLADTVSKKFAAVWLMSLRNDCSAEKLQEVKCLGPLKELPQENQTSRNMDKLYRSLVPKFPESKHSHHPKSLEKHAKALFFFLKQKPDEEDKERRKEVLTRGPTSPWAQWAPERAMWIGTDLIAFHKESLANHREGYDERAVFCCKDKLKIAC